MEILVRSQTWEHVLCVLRPSLPSKTPGNLACAWNEMKIRQRKGEPSSSAARKQREKQLAALATQARGAEFNNLFPQRAGMVAHTDNLINREVGARGWQLPQVQ